MTFNGLIKFLNTNCDFNAQLCRLASTRFGDYSVHATKLLSYICVSMLLVVGTASAQTKVVVVPLADDSSAARDYSSESCAEGETLRGFDEAGDLVCDNSPTVNFVSIDGTNRDCRGVATGAYAVIGSTATPEADILQLALNLDRPATVLIQFDMTVTPTTDGSWAAFRLNINGTPDTRSTHVQGNTGLEKHVHLHKIVELAAGNHTIAAEWGLGAGDICSEANSIWIRRLSALILQ